jgi:ATP-dependent RNA helicase HrpB
LMRVGTVDAVRRAASDIARRAGIAEAGADPDRAGFVLASAFPDRLAVLRGSPGRYQLRTGNRAWIAEDDPLAPERFLIPADLDGNRKETRIRLAAAIDADDVATLFSHDVIEQSHLRWIGDRLVERRERKLGGVALNTIDVRPEPCEETTAALLKRVTERGLNTLAWSEPIAVLCARVSFLHRHLGLPWPDWSQDALLGTLETWLAPYLGNSSGMDDLRSIDVTSILRGQLDHRLSGQLDRLAPPRLSLPSGRSLKLDYSTDVPIVRVKVQEVFGLTQTPTVGGVPVVLHLLSPADRPVQITSDLAGFWEGSWAEVRKEMAGRYPKHYWPEDPANATPGRHRGR